MHAVVYYQPEIQRQFNALTSAQRELAVYYVAPNGEQVSNEGLRIFFTLIQSRVIEFADADTANEHLHVRHDAASAKYFCTTCYARQLVAV